MAKRTRRAWALKAKRTLGGLRRERSRAPLPGAAWYAAEREGAGFEYRFPAGALARARWLTTDLLLDGTDLAVFKLTLREGADGAPFEFHFGLLTRCQARARMPLSAVDQNRWLYEREGAWLKPLCGGARVDLSRVDRATFTVMRKGPRPVRWAMTPLAAVVRKPRLLTRPLLPKGPLLDELGQSTQHDWPGKSRSAAEVTARLRAQRAAAGDPRWPEGFSRYGGWTAKRFEATGWFRTHHDGRRWWLVDPEGYAFWSAGQDCVSPRVESAFRGLETALAWRPEAKGPYAAAYGRRGGRPATLSYLIANLIRAFAPQEWRTAWAGIALAELRRTGFNTVANWSDWQIAKQAGFPYVRPLHADFPKTPKIFRDFPDVFDPAFVADCEAFVAPLRETAEDPAFIGYFLMNEPNWGFARQTPAEGMLYNTTGGAAREALADYAQSKHRATGGVAAAWGAGATPEALRKGRWSLPLSAAARADLEAFSSILVNKLYAGLSRAAKRADPHHLNLGARYYTTPPPWALAGMRCFDVFSINCYQQRVPPEKVKQLSEALERPVLIGEWHFGALDAGLPASGIGHVRDQAARGQAYRVYLEQAAALPGCVGVHYFTLYDQSALGRFDGENYNIGFVDVCHRPYEELAAAAREAHARMYPVALGEVPPYAEAPEYLPLLFM